MDVNADLGEGAGTLRRAEDEALLDVVSSANIACGYHAGDAVTMSDTVLAAKERGVTIGAHPSYPDIPGFGRRELGLSPKQIELHVARQIEILAEVCASHTARLAYVKPHGALYNRAVRDESAARAIVSAIRSVNPSLTLLGLPDSEMENAANSEGMSFAREAFVDRAYRSDGTLVPRGEPGAVIADIDAAIGRALKLVREKTVASIEGRQLRVDADSLCVHGDSPDAAGILRALRNALEADGVAIAPFAA